MNTCSICTLSCSGNLKTTHHFLKQMARKTSVDLLRCPYQVKLKSQVGNPVASSTNQTICTLYELACSRHSDSGVRHEVKEKDEKK